MAESTSVRLVGNLITAQFHAAALYVAIFSNVTTTINEDVTCNVFMQSVVYHIPSTTYNQKSLRLVLLRIRKTSDLDLSRRPVTLIRLYIDAQCLKIGRGRFIHNQPPTRGYRVYYFIIPCKVNYIK